MEIIKSVNEIKDTSRILKGKNKVIGLVPTMGYLHEGHMSLVRRCREENDKVIISIFVNPTQFGPDEDFEKYPRDAARDIRMLEKEGADYLFMPEADEMYGRKHSTFIEVKGVTEQMCGGSRPGHFSGVATVVAKLFNICRPDNAYFGQKDYQQSVMIKKMARELDFDTKIIVCPIVREDDGLAMSSRNVYLGAEQRKQAPIIYKALKKAEEAISIGEKDAKKIEGLVRSAMETLKGPDIEYIEIRDADDLSYAEIIDGPVVIAIAVRFGGTRLIDNILTGGA